MHTVRLNRDAVPVLVDPEQVVVKLACVARRSRACDLPLGLAAELAVAAVVDQAVAGTLAAVGSLVEVADIGLAVAEAVDKDRDSGSVAVAGRTRRKAECLEVAADHAKRYAPEQKPAFAPTLV